MAARILEMENPSQTMTNEMEILCANSMYMIHSQVAYLGYNAYVIGIT